MSKPTRGYWDKNHMKYEKQEQTSERESVKSILQYKIADLSDRGIRDDIAEKFGVRAAVSQEDGKTQTAIYFPYYNQKGNLCGWKRRDLTKDKDEKGHFTTIGKVGTACKLFGSHVADSNERPKKRVHIVEGEFDVLASFQALVDSVADSKYAHLEPFVVGLNCGTVNAVEAVQHNLDWVDNFDTIVLGFDNDRAETPKEIADGIVRGAEATQAVGASLMRDNILIAEYKEGMKDPNDYVIAGESKELAAALLWTKKKFVAEKVVRASEVPLEELTAPRVEGIDIPTLPKLMRKIHGFRKRELTIVTGPSGVGKSFLTSEIAYYLAKSGYRVGMIFLEETRKETLQRMMARYLTINYNNFKDNPQVYASPEKLREAKDWIDDGDRFVLLDHFGSIRIEQLMAKIKALTYIDKCDFILLDHLSMTISGLKESDERKLLDITMTELAAYCASNDVGVIAVSHINRDVATDFKAPKGEEDKPFWVQIRKETLRGSAAIEQLSWIIIAIEPEIMPDRSRGRVRLTVLKNRPWSYLGQCDILKMNEQTGLLENADFSF